MKRSFYTVRTFARINTRRFFRDKLALFFGILFPLIFLFVFGGIFGRNDGGVSFHVALINESTTPVSQQFVKQLESGKGFNVDAEAKTLDAAKEKIENRFDPARDAAIVIGARGWHQGVLGIVASRIARRYHRPTIVIGFDENGLGKGSGRSIEGLNLVEALSSCAERLDKFGGHEMAAGLALHEGDFDLFAKGFCKAAGELLSERALQPCVRLDHELAFTEIDIDFLRWHEMLQPFGNGNPQPLFIARDIEPVAPPRVVNEKHLIFRLRQGDRHRRAIYFDGVTNPLPPTPWDIAFRIHADNYEGETLIAMQIDAVREAERCGCDQ